MQRGKGGRGLAARRLCSATVARVHRVSSTSHCLRNVALRSRTCRARVTVAQKRNRGVREMSIRLFRGGDARARIARPIVVAVLSLSCGVAIAQQQPDAGQLLQQQREPLRLPPPQDDVRPRPPQPKPALPVSPTLKVRVTQFTFSGNTLYSDEELAQVVQEFVGKELDFEGLNDAATKVRAYHRSRGYFLAQAY